MVPVGGPFKFHELKELHGEDAKHLRAERKRVFQIIDSMKDVEDVEQLRLALRQIYDIIHENSVKLTRSTRFCKAVYNFRLRIPVPQPTKKEGKSPAPN
jgi:hypothetical protein